MKNCWVGAGAIVLLCSVAVANIILPVGWLI